MTSKLKNSHNKSYIIIAAILFAVSFIIFFITTQHEPTAFNNFVRLADAFLNERLYLLRDVPYLELAPFGGKYYVIPPPMPAILMLPVVAIYGLATNQTLISIFFGSLNVSLAFLAARSLTKNRVVQIWSAVMFGFGTIHWWIATAGGVWTFSQTISITFLFIAILFSVHSFHPLPAGLALGASYWTRLPTILSFPYFMAMSVNKWYRPKETNIINRINLKPLIIFGLGVGIFIVFNAIYNLMRFNTPFDISYYLIPGVLGEPWFQEGIFDVTYIPRHLKVIFLGLPKVLDESPYVLPSLNGMAIWITTPAFIYAFRAGIRNKLAIGCWLSILLIAAVTFCHGTWGFTQFGYRFAADFYPFLFLLTVKGIGDKIRWHHIILITVGIVVNLWGVLWIHKFGWLGF